MDFTYVITRDPLNCFMINSATLQILARSWKWQQLTPWSRVLEKPTVAQLLMNFPTFYGTKGSFPCSQESSTSPYPESDESSSNHFILFL
jgi:hypothetical protein